jgi:prefoldin alpha subunit
VQVLSDEENAQALALQVRLLEDYYRDISNRENVLLRMYREDKACLASVSTLKDSKQFDLLVPIGGGAYLPVAFAGGNKLLVDIGSGMAMEKTPEDAIAFLNGRVKEIDETLQTVAAQKREVTQRLQAYQQQLDLMMSESVDASKPTEQPPGDG